MYYPCSKNKDADQLRGYREADLRLCFRICRLLVFPRGGSYTYINSLARQGGIFFDCQTTYTYINSLARQGGIFFDCQTTYTYINSLARQGGIFFDAGSFSISYNLS